MVWTGGSQGSLAPAVRALFAQADAGWPDRSKRSDGTLGDTAHASRTSDHNPKPPNPPGWVDAGDLTEDHEHGPSLPALWNHLIDTRDWRVKYLIYEGRIVKSYVDGSGRPAWVPQPYTGPNPHSQHLHVSVTAAGRMDTGPWFPTTTEETDDMNADELVALFESDPRLDTALKRKINEALTYGVNLPAGTDRIGGVITGTLEGIRAVYARLVGGDVDEAEVARLVLEGLAEAEFSGSQVETLADAIEALPPAVADELDRRARARLGG